MPFVSLNLWNLSLEKICKQLEKKKETIQEKKNEISLKNFFWKAKIWQFQNSIWKTAFCSNSNFLAILSDSINKNFILENYLNI